MPVTVFLTGDENKAIREAIYGEVIFLGYSSKALSGLKLKVFLDLLKIYKSYSFERIIAHRYKPIYLACLLSATSYRSVIYGVVHSAKTFDRFFRRVLVAMMWRKVVLLGVSNSLSEELKSSFASFANGPTIKTFYNRINVGAHREELLQKQEARRKLGLPDDAFVFGNVARLHPKKNQALLLSAFARVADQLPGAVVALIGDGELKEELLLQARSLNIADRVIFCGFVAGASRYYRAFDVFVLTSVVETFGFVLLESMIAGIPVVASNVGGVPEVVGSSALLFDSGNSAELADCLLAVFDDKEHPAFRQAMKERVENLFSLSSGREDILALFQAEK